MENFNCTDTEAFTLCWPFDLHAAVKIYGKRFIAVFILTHNERCAQCNGKSECGFNDIERNPGGNYEHGHTNSSSPRT